MSTNPTNTNRRKVRELLDQTPPCDLGAERAVIGSMLLDGSTCGPVAQVLRAADFHDPANVILFGQILKLHNEGQPIDLKLVHHRLSSTPGRKGTLLDDIGGSETVSRIFSEGATAANATHYARIVKERAIQRRARLFAEEIIATASNGMPCADLITMLASGAADIAADAPMAKRVEYELVTSAELDANDYDLEYLIPGVLVAGQPCILAGAKKVLKTSLLVDLAISLDRCGHFLGRIPVSRAANVAMMSGESGFATLQETARRICAAGNYRLPDLGILWSKDLPKLDSPDHLEALDAIIVHNGIEVLGVDPAYLAMPGGDAGNLFIQGELLRGISGVCEQHGVTLILCHHTRKGGKADPFSPPELEDIAWAGFQEYARQWLLVRRRERYEPGSGDHRLWLNVGGSAGHSQLLAVDIVEGEYEPGKDRVWQVAVKRAVEARQDAHQRIEQAKQDERRAKLDSDKTTVLDAMKVFPVGETKNVLRTAAGMSGARFDAVLAALLRDKHVEACEVTKGNRKEPYEGFRLPKRSQSDQSDK